MQRLTKIHLVFTVTVILLANVTLWGIGLWTPASARYWRRPAQSVVFALARITPRSYVGPITRLALRTHVEGTTYEEIEMAAALFQSGGDNRSAAQLWLAQLRQDVAANRPDEAERHATLSQAAAPSEKALAALVMLNIKKPQSRDRWIADLQKAFPEHELSAVSLCLAQLDSFERFIPPACDRVRWVADKAIASRNKYQELTSQIQDLPNERRLKVAEFERDIARQASKRWVYTLEIDEIERQKTATILNAIVEVIVNLLPLPRANDTIASWALRVGLCKVFPLTCSAIEAAKPIFTMLQRRRELEEQRKSVLQLIGYSDSISRLDKQQLAYWRSNKPLEALQTDRNNVLPTFRDSLMETVSAKAVGAGLSLDEALSVVIH